MQLQGLLKTPHRSLRVSFQAVRDPQAIVSHSIRRVAFERFLERISHAERPVLVAGGGVVRSGAEAALRRFAEAVSLPVATSLN